MSGFDPKEYLRTETRDTYKQTVTPEGRPAEIHFHHDEWMDSVIARELCSKRHAVGLMPVSIRPIPSEEDLLIGERNALKALDDYCNSTGG